MKKILVIISLVATSLILKAQYTPMSNYVQPTPNVGSLGKYADYPVSYYTGTPNISIPLYELKDGAASFPVSLSYHASGIRVSELASWVGLGWSLNCGGMITRSVRGAPDEGAYNAQASPTGYFGDSGLKKLPILPYPINGIISANNPPNSAEIRSEFLAVLNAGGADCEPDLYTFNFNGHTGKFVFDENRVPRLLTEQDVKIAVNWNGGDFTSWVITTPDGTNYYFGESNMHEVNSISSNSNLTDQNSLRPSSWFLTRIVYPNSKDTLNLTYTTESYTYFDLGQETKVFGGIGQSPLTQACNIDQYEDVATNVYKSSVTGLRLNSIKSKNYTISFGVANTRKDLKGTSYQLDSIKVYNNQSQCLKQYLFSYSYFVSSTYGHIPTNGLALVNGDTSDCNRLKLLSVKELSGDGLSIKPPYVFTYQETQQLPRRMNYGQDHWGYYNGNDDNNKFTPTPNNYLCKFFSGQGAFRESNWPSMQAFSIKTIRDPLGVVTTFQFESHTAYWYGQSSNTVGGLRIHQITTTDSLTGSTQYRLFNYGNGGNLYKIPNYLIVLQNEFYYFNCSGLPGPASYRGYGYQLGECVSNAIRQSQSVVPLQDFQGNHVGYPLVKEIYGQNGEGGYKQYSYMADPIYNNNSRLDMSNYTAFTTMSNIWYGSGSGIFGNGHFNDIPPDSLHYASSSIAQQLYPFAPDQVDFQRGQLMWEETFDSSNMLISSKRNVYEEVYNEKRLIRGFKLFRSIGGFKSTGSGTGYQYDDALTYYKLHTGRTRIAFDTTISYKDGKTFSAIHRYKYEDTLHTMPTSILTINSMGDSILNKTYYSFDYTSGADAVFAKMKARNMLLPVSSRIWKNNQLIGGSITKFADFASSSSDTFINPIKVYALETSSPMSTVAAGENVSFTSQYTSLLPNASFMEKANFNFDGSTGRIKEQRLINDKTQSMIWDNNLKLPLAQVDNAYYADIAYSSFESVEKGGWTYTGTIVSDAGAPTGGKAYTISSGSISKTITSAQKYILSYWSTGSVTVTGGTQTNNTTGRTIGSYTYHEITITGTTSISISGSGSIDEVKIYPLTAQMTTYTYDNLLRLIATCNPNSLISHYDYDSFNRLVDIKDQYGNVIKAFEYNYGQLSR